MIKSTLRGHVIVVSSSILGYEPAGLTVHPPPKKNDRGLVNLFRIGV